MKKHKILTLRLHIFENKKVIAKEIKLEDFDDKQILMAVKQLK